MSSNDTQFEIIGLGAALVDMLANVPDELLRHNNLNKGHMHLIDAGAAAQILAQVPQAQKVSGGSAANTCLGVASFGGRAAFMGRVADDALGSFFAADLQAGGTTYFNLSFGPTGAGNSSTGYCTSLVTEDGERTMCTYLGASGEYDASALSPAILSAITSAKLLYLEGYIWDTPARAAAADLAIKAARGAGRQVGFTLSDGWVADKYREIFMGYLNAKMVDVLFANEHEIVTLLQATSYEQAEQAAAALAPTVVITRSEKGAVVLQGPQKNTVAAAPVARVVDATGAGDLFAAGFLYGYLTGQPVTQAARLGALAAAEVISHMGARPLVKLSDLARQAA